MEKKVRISYFLFLFLLIAHSCTKNEKKATSETKREISKENKVHMKGNGYLLISPSQIKKIKITDNNGISLELDQPAMLILDEENKVNTKNGYGLTHIENEVEIFSNCLCKDLEKISTDLNRYFIHNCYKETISEEQKQCFFYMKLETNSVTAYNTGKTYGLVPAKTSFLSSQRVLVEKMNTSLRGLDDLVGSSKHGRRKGKSQLFKTVTKDVMAAIKKTELKTRGLQSRSSSIQEKLAELGETRVIPQDVWNKAHMLQKELENLRVEARENTILQDIAGIREKLKAYATARKSDSKQTASWTKKETQVSALEGRISSLTESWDKLWQEERNLLDSLESKRPQHHSYDAPPSGANPFKVGTKIERRFKICEGGVCPEAWDASDFKAGYTPPEALGVRDKEELQITVDGQAVVIPKHPIQQTREYARFAPAIVNGRSFSLGDVSDLKENLQTTKFYQGLWDQYRRVLPGEAEKINVQDFVTRTFPALHVLRKDNEGLIMTIMTREGEDMMVLPETGRDLLEAVGEGRRVPAYSYDFYHKGGKTYFAVSFQQKFRRISPEVEDMDLAKSETAPISLTRRFLVELGTDSPKFSSEITRVHKDASSSVTPSMMDLDELIQSVEPPGQVSSSPRGVWERIPGD